MDAFVMKYKIQTLKALGEVSFEIIINGNGVPDGLTKKITSN